MDQIKIFVPAHLTGFFEICNGTSILATGSRGAGLSISKGVITEIYIEKSEDTDIKIFINNKLMKNAKVSQFVVDYYLNKVKNNLYKIQINHIIDFPIGNGFGASGGAALGISYGLNVLLKLNQTRNECAQIAHIAEVSNKTGLGDIIAQTFGGVEIRLEPGAPGIGKLDNIICLPDWKIICYTNGKIDTSSIISDEIYIQSINKAGNKLTKELLKSPSLSNLMNLSYKFARESGLLPEKIYELLHNLHSEGYINSSMIMLGESLFCAIEKTKAQQVYDFISANISNGELFIADIDYNGGRIIG
ncbi:MAG: pantoate kinase [Candidatus Helarchaeota archaeon]